MLNDTLNTTLETAKPYLPLLAAVKEEVIETALFVNKYYSIEENLRKKIVDNVEFYGKRLVTKVSHHSLDLVNITVR